MNAFEFARRYVVWLTIATFLVIAGLASESDRGFAVAGAILVGACVLHSWIVEARR
jgi:hypothetical protein